jgi:hypothetical protein
MNKFHAVLGKVEGQQMWKVCRKDGRSFDDGIVSVNYIPENKAAATAHVDRLNRRLINCAVCGDKDDDTICRVCRDEGWLLDPAGGLYHADEDPNLLYR